MRLTRASAGLTVSAWTRCPGRRMKLRNRPVKVWICAFLIAASSHAASADQIKGADDPTFAALMKRALAEDDPSITAGLHALASNGNTAALLVLPFVSRWIPSSGSLADKNRLRRIGDATIADLAADASSVLADWAGGGTATGPVELRARAMRLIEAGEFGKGGFLFANWFNQTGGSGDLPEGFIDLPLHPSLTAMILTQRFVFSPVETDRSAIIDLLRADRIEGWMVIARVEGLTALDVDQRRPWHNEVVELLTAASIDPASAIPKVIAAGRILKSDFASPLDPPLSIEDAAIVQRAYSNRADFAPVHAYCTSRCTDAPEACETAFIVAFGHPLGLIEGAQPPVSVLPTEELMSSPRGEQLLLGAALARYGKFAGKVLQSPRFAGAAEISSCLAVGMGRVQAARN
jgi:hypothetical protein